MAGKPSKRTPEVRAVLIQALTAGNSRRAACAYAGISDETLARWMHADVDFADAIKKAEAAPVVRAVALIHQAAAENWQAAAWFLERRYPDEWGRRDVLRIEWEKVIEQTRQLALARGLDPDEAVAEVELLLAETRRGRGRGGT